MHSLTQQLSACTPPQDSNWGIDTIAVEIPIDPEQVDSTAGCWEASRSRMKGIGFNPILSGTVKVQGVTVHRKLNTDRQVVRLEFNAARLVVPVPDLLPIPAITPLISGLVMHLNSTLGCSLVEVDYATGEVSLVAGGRSRCESAGWMLPATCKSITSA